MGVGVMEPPPKEIHINNYIKLKLLAADVIDEPRNIEWDDELENEVWDKIRENEYFKDKELVLMRISNHIFGIVDISPADRNVLYIYEEVVE